MEYLKKYLSLGLLVILSIVLLVLAFKFQTLEEQKKRAIAALSLASAENRKAELALGKARTREGNADKIKTNLSKQLKDAIEARNEAIRLSGRVKYVYVYKGSIHASRTPEHTTTSEISPTQAASGLVFHFSDSKLDATCMVNESISEADFDYRLHLNFESSLLKTITEDGVENYYLEVFETSGKKEKIKLQKFEIVTEDQRERHLSFTPHIEIAGAALLDSTLQVGAGVSVVLSSVGYGITDNDLLWKFMCVSVDFNDSVGLGFTPIEYNIGSVVPLFSNLWLGPHIGIRLDGKYQAGVTIGANL